LALGPNGATRELEPLCPFREVERSLAPDGVEQTVRIVGEPQVKAAPQAELLALAVHEFRTPVTVVSGYLRMLAREQLGTLNERQRKLVEESERSCARLSALVAEMSELANLEAEEATLAAEDLSLGSVLEDAASRVDDGRERDVTVEIAARDNGVTISGDRKRLTAALAALLRAVVREQTEAGRVLMDVNVDDSGGRRTAVIRIGRPDDATGAIDTAPDSELNEFKGGLGLSVPIARRVIDRHGGRVQSSAGRKMVGSVAVWLPLKETHS
jgi:signal transduction histidine kinase